MKPSTQKPTSTSKPVAATKPVASKVTTPHPNVQKSAPAPQIKQVEEKKSHPIRSFFSAFFGIWGLFLILPVVMTFWINSTLTSTNTFVKTITPVTDNQEIRTYISEKAADAIIEKFEDSQIVDISEKILTPTERVGKNVAQLRETLMPVVSNSFNTVLSSEKNRSLLTSTITNAHKDIIKALDASNMGVTINARPLIDSALNDLSTTRLAPIKDKLLGDNGALPADAGIINIKETDLKNPSMAYSSAKKASLGLLILFATLILLSVLIAANHIKTARRLLMATAVITGIFGVFISLSSMITNKIAAEQNAQDATLAKTLPDILFKDLRTLVFTVSAVCFVLAISGIIYRLVRKPFKK